MEPRLKTFRQFREACTYGFFGSDRCPVFCPVLSAALVYCGQTVGWIKMKLGMEVGLVPGHIALDGDPDPPKGAHPQFAAHVCCATRLDGSRCHLVQR